MNPQDRPVWAGSISYQPVWDYMRTVVKAQSSEINVSQHDQQAFLYDQHIFNCIHDSVLLKMHPDQFNALPDWDDPAQGIDYALNTELPFRSIYFEVSTLGQAPDWATLIPEHKLMAYPFAFMLSRLPDGGLWVVTLAHLDRREDENGYRNALVDPNGNRVSHENFILPSVVFGGTPFGADLPSLIVDAESGIEHHMEINPHVAFRTSENRDAFVNPYSPAMGLASALAGGFNPWLANGLHSSTEIDLSAVVGFPTNGRVLFADCKEQQYRAQRANSRQGVPAGLGHKPIYPHNDQELSYNLLYYSKAPVKIALRALAALSILDAAEVEIVDEPLHRRELRKIAKRGKRWQVSKIVRIGKPREHTQSEPTGKRAHYSHRFWVRGHVKHFGPNTRVYQNREDLVTPCTRHGNHQCEGGFCRKVKTAPFIKGPDDKPLVAKSRIWAVPQHEDEPEDGAA